jgi:hypothetical protein
MPHNGLLDRPRRWVSRPVGVELGVIACGVVSECLRRWLLLRGRCAHPVARRCSKLNVSHYTLSLQAHEPVASPNAAAQSSRVDGGVGGSSPWKRFATS